MVAKKSVSDADFKKMQALLKSYDLADLEKTGMVSSDIEKLEPYKETLKEYVGEYGNYINALSQKPSGASSVAVSLALQIIAVVALTLLS